MSYLTCSRGALDDIRQCVSARAVRATSRFLFSLDFRFLQQNLPGQVKKENKNLFSLICNFTLRSERCQHKTFYFCKPARLIQFRFLLGAECWIKDLILIHTEVRGSRIWSDDPLLHGWYLTKRDKYTFCLLDKMYSASNEIFKLTLKGGLHRTVHMVVLQRSSVHFTLTLH